MSAHEAAQTWDCKTPDCNGEAFKRTGPYAMLCRLCTDDAKAAKRASQNGAVAEVPSDAIQTPVEPAQPAPSFERRAATLVETGQQLDTALAAYQSARAALEEATRAWREAELDRPDGWHVDVGEEGDSEIAWRELPDGQIQVRVGPGREREGLVKEAERRGRPPHEALASSLHEHVERHRVSTPAPVRSPRSQGRAPRRNIRHGPRRARAPSSQQEDPEPPLARPPFEGVGVSFSDLIVEIAAVRGPKLSAEAQQRWDLRWSAGQHWGTPRKRPDPKAEPRLERGEATELYALVTQAFDCATGRTSMTPSPRWSPGTNVCFSPGSSVTSSGRRGSRERRARRPC